MLSRKAVFHTENKTEVAMVAIRIIIIMAEKC